MMKKLRDLLVGLTALGFLVLLAIYFQPVRNLFQSNGIQQVGFDGKVYHQFTDLPEGIIAQSGDIKISSSEINDSAAMRAFKNKRRDVLFAVIYKQYVSYNDGELEKISFSFKKTSMSAHKILQEYGVPVKLRTEVEFSAFPEAEGLAKISDKVITEQDINYNNFIWASFETEIFRYKLAAIDKLLKRKIMESEAKKLNLTTTQYFERYVKKKLPIEVSFNDVEKYLKKYGLEKNARNISSAKSRILEKRHRRGMNYVLERYVMQLPVQIDLKTPEYRLVAKQDWTPIFGDGPLKMTLFSDTRSDSGKNLISGIMKLMRRYNGLQFFYRPLYTGKNNLQKLTSEMHFCVFHQKKDRFWDYLSATLGDFGEQTESTLLSKADALSLPTTDLKKCMEVGKYKQVVDYHLDYANYLGIQSSPVLYVGGEVLHGNIRLEDIEAIIQRELQVPVAGVW